MVGFVRHVRKEKDMSFDYSQFKKTQNDQHTNESVRNLRLHILDLVIDWIFEICRRK